MMRSLLLFMMVILSARGMKTVGSFEGMKAALRERQEVIVMSGHMEAMSTLFLSYNVSLSSESRKMYALDGRGSSQLLVVTGDSDVLLEDLSLRGGFSSGGGGALSILGGATVEIVRCTITTSVADIGGGVYVSLSALTLRETVFSSNSARSGAALYASESTVTITDSTFTQNKAKRDGGGAVLLRSSHADMKRSTFESNSASYRGGAVRAERETVLTAFECLFRQNLAFAESGTSRPAAGGALAVDSGSTCGLTKSVFEHCSADQGGAVSLDGKSSLATFGCSFTKNSAQLGGAIAIEDAGQWTDSGSTIAENRADMEGGGAYLTADSTFTSKHTQLSKNSPDESFVMSTLAAPHDANYLALGRRRLLAGDQLDDLRLQEDIMDSAKGLVTFFLVSFVASLLVVTAVFRRRGRQWSANNTHHPEVLLLL